VAGGPLPESEIETKVVKPGNARGDMLGGYLAGAFGEAGFMRRGLVLEGGGAKGACALGCLMAFREHGVEFDVNPIPTM
jgi:hypothetical protein